jgi:predicted RND superfamily exporter protein
MIQSSEQKEILDEFLKLESNKIILVTVKGTDQKSLDTLIAIEKELSKLNSINKDKLKINKKLLEYKEKYQLYINDLEINKLKNIDVENELQKLYTSLFDSFIITDINTLDPLSIVKKNQNNINIKNGKLLLKEYGYLSVYTINNDKNSLNEYENIYDKIKEIEEKYMGMKSFSSVYYFVENSRYIKNDATTIMILASFILLVLYLYFLRNIALLINTMLTLTSSAILATLVLTLLYKELSIFVVVFGIPISTIAIDYMFHHYFHGYYKKYKGFNKEVFLGFFTTFTAFLILSFVDFLLIKQITIFSMISLLCSYAIFSFIYPNLKFNETKYNFSIKKIEVFNSKYILLFSMIILLYSVQNLNFDFNVQSLNYDNKELKKTEQFFKEKITNNKQQVVLIKGKTIDELISYSEKIKRLDNGATSSLDILISKKSFEKKQQEFLEIGLDNIKNEIEKFSKKIGFKDGSFNKSYNYTQTIPEYTFDMLLDFDVSVQKYKEQYIVPIYVSNSRMEDVLDLDFVYPVNIKILFEKNLENNLNKIVNLGLLSLVFIVLIIIIITKNKILNAISFLSLPSAFIFFYLSFININILHIFMFFIILAISIDYAIYSSKDNNESTKKAIMFSALSSFAGFGVLIFSSTPSLYSIGSIASLGITAILLLILFKKEMNVS